MLSILQCAQSDNLALKRADIATEGVAVIVPSTLAQALLHGCKPLLGLEAKSSIVANSKPITTDHHKEEHDRTDKRLRQAVGDRGT